MRWSLGPSSKLLWRPQLTFPSLPVPVPETALDGRDRGEWSGLSCASDVLFILWGRLGHFGVFWARVEVSGVPGHFVLSSGWDSFHEITAFCSLVWYSEL